MNLTCLDLFSGIGGFALGFQRAGIETVAFCESDRRATYVLRKRFPGVPVFSDVRRLTKQAYDDWEMGDDPDIICGGFPCQDISKMGTRLGLAGARSGLWWQFYRVIQVFSPRWVVIENVSELRRNGLVEVLRSLCEIGYDAEWHCITASSFGFPHRRDRIWIVAYPYGRSEPVVRFDDEAQGLSRVEGEIDASYAHGTRGKGSFAPGCVGESRQRGRNSEEDLRHVIRSPFVSTAGVPQSLVRGMDDGLSPRVDRTRLKLLGNSLVPDIAEFIGRAIVRADKP